MQSAKTAHTRDAPDSGCQTLQPTSCNQTGRPYYRDYDHERQRKQGVSHLNIIGEGEANPCLIGAFYTLPTALVPTRVIPVITASRQRRVPASGEQTVAAIESWLIIHGTLWKKMQQTNPTM